MRHITMVLALALFLPLTACASAGPGMTPAEVAAEQARLDANRERIRQERVAEREARIRAYGWPADVTAAVLGNRVLVGMFDSMVRESWGRPDSINVTTMSDGEREQWVYRDRGAYVYFEKGRVVAIQSSRR
jgi:hypothetical protein